MRAISRVEAGRRFSGSPARARRGGYAAVLSMIFLVIGTSLVAGLYGMVSTSTAITDNQQHVADALSAAESGLGMIQPKLAALQVQYVTDASNPSAMLDAAASDLWQSMGVGNIGSALFSSSGSGTAKIYTSPAIALPGGRSFVLQLSYPGGDPTKGLLVTVTGTAAGAVAGMAPVTRTLSLTYTEARQSGAWTPTAGLVAEGTITQSKGQITWFGDPTMPAVFSGSSAATSMNLTGGKVNGGMVAVLNNKSQVALGATINSVSNQTQIISQYVEVLPHPSMPSIDPAFYTALRAALPSDPGGKFISNCVVSGSRSFSGKNSGIGGVIYVKAGSTLNFGGGALVNAAIVVEPGPGTTINFGGNNISYEPSQANPILKQWGYDFFSMIAPDADVFISGTSGPTSLKGPDGQPVGGTVLCHDLTTQGNSGYTAMGVVVATGDVNVSGNTGITIYPWTGGSIGTSDGTNHSQFAIVLTSYSEF